MGKTWGGEQPSVPRNERLNKTAHMQIRVCARFKYTSPDVSMRSSENYHDKLELGAQYLEHFSRGKTSREYWNIFCERLVSLE